MNRSLVAAAMAWCAVFPLFAFGADYPAVVDIRLDGEPTTQASVLLRELALGIGDPADPILIARSRQSLLDLKLFRDVVINEVPEANGVALVISVVEKRYLLALPRFDSSSDGDLSYGAQMRWNNAWGLNHVFDARFLTGEYPDNRLREEETGARLRYSAPYVSGHQGVDIEFEFLDRAAPIVGGTFDERIRRAEFLVTYDLRDTRPRGGWIMTSGLHLRSQDASGPLAPQRDGTTTALVLGAHYANVRHHVYSDSGRDFLSRFEIAQDGWLSDYGYRMLDLRLLEQIPLAYGAHHSLNLIGAAGWHSGGPRRVSAYALGGSGSLRGYDLDYLEGERYAHVSAEYLRPIFGFNWARLLIVAESGWTGGSVTGARSGGPYTSIGAGLRFRVTWFMNLEIELGVAYPLRGGDGLQFFAGGG